MNTTTTTRTIGATIPASSIAQATQAFPALRYVLLNRPAAGNGSGALAAHTAAAFEALGLYRGETVPRATLVRVWGQSAHDYHQGLKGEKYKGNPAFDVSESGYSLNDAGFSRFGELRTVDPELSAVFFEMMTTGKAPDTCPNAFRALKPV